MRPTNHLVGYENTVYLAEHREVLMQYGEQVRTRKEKLAG
jgi:hypothetical protein